MIKAEIGKKQTQKLRKSWHLVTVISVIKLNYRDHRQCLAPGSKEALRYLETESSAPDNAAISGRTYTVLYVTFPYISREKPNENTDSEAPAAVSRILCPEHPAARNFCPNKRSYQEKETAEWSWMIQIQLKVGSSTPLPSPFQAAGVLHHHIYVCHPNHFSPMIWILEENHILSNFYNCHDCKVEHGTWEVATATIQPPSSTIMRIGQLDSWLLASKGSLCKRKLPRVLFRGSWKLATQKLRLCAKNDRNLIRMMVMIWWYPLISICATGWCYQYANDMLPTHTGRWIVKAAGTFLPLSRPNKANLFDLQQARI